jgi:hypothetical protein
MIFGIFTLTMAAGSRFVRLGQRFVAVSKEILIALTAMGVLRLVFFCHIYFFHPRIYVVGRQ